MPKSAVPTLVPAAPVAKPATRRITIRACRPSFIDLRFKGDPWVVRKEQAAVVCLGDFTMGQVTVSPLDVPSLNRALLQVRFGQARRNYSLRMRKPDEAA
jgi:hypothetical protein